MACRSHDGQLQTQVSWWLGWTCSCTCAAQAQHPTLNPRFSGTLYFCCCLVGPKGSFWVVLVEKNSLAIPGLPGGLIIYQGHLFAPKGHLWVRKHGQAKGFLLVAIARRRLRAASLGWTSATVDSMPLDSSSCRRRG